MKKYDLSELTEFERKVLYKRPAINSTEVEKIVKPILQEIKVNGLNAVIKYAKEFDKLDSENITISAKEIKNAKKLVSAELQNAILTAKSNIEKFHELQKPNEYEIETSEGVICGQTFRAIESVGLYIPGGSAPLFSTLLMLGLPAKIAGCKRIVICTPTFNGNVNKELLFIADLLEINEIYKIGGAQAIGLMAYGTEQIGKVDKIFGPGNQFVTAAKNLVSVDPDGCAIDMPAGPSEVLIIADEQANPKFVAVDLLSQAEHGIDSQVVLLSTSEKLINDVEKEIINQLEKLPRKDFAEKSLANSLLIKGNSIPELVEFSNHYAPEHLIMNFENAKEILDKVTNAGSVFLGEYSTESAGDYASGTNHSLPTYGYAKSFSGVNVRSFMKSISYQKLSKSGIEKLGPAIVLMAEAEQLEAHANAVRVRING